MRTALFRLALVICVTVGCQGSAEQSTAGAGEDVPSTDHGLELTASPVQTTVPAEGPLEVEITIRNASESVVRFRPVFVFGRWLDAEVLDAAGSPIPKTAEIDPPNAWAVSLGTGESITDTVDLRCSLPVPEENSCMAPYDLSGPGAYEVKMHFTLPCDIEGCGERVKLEAEPFTLRVRGEEN